MFYFANIRVPGYYSPPIGVAEEDLEIVLSDITSTDHMKINSDVTINLSLVADVEAFAYKITCGKVTKVTDRVITITAN